MSDETPPESFLTPLGVKMPLAVQDARFTLASISTESSLEGRCLFLLTTEAHGWENAHVVDEEEQNIVLDYSSFTDAWPAKEVLCLMEVRSKEAEVRDTDSL
jgi:hypothetical protein